MNVMVQQSNCRCAWADLTRNLLVAFRRLAGWQLGLLLTCPPFIPTGGATLSPDTGPSGTLAKLVTADSTRVHSVQVEGRQVAIRGFSTPYLLTLPYDLKAGCTYPIMITLEGGGEPKKVAFKVTENGSRRKPRLRAYEVGYYRSGSTLHRNILELVVYGSGFDTESTILVDGIPVETFAAGFSMKGRQDRRFRELEVYCEDPVCRPLSGEGPTSCYERALIGLVPTWLLGTSITDHIVTVANTTDGASKEVSSSIKFKVPQRVLTVRLDWLDGTLNGVLYRMPLPRMFVCHEGEFATWRRAFGSSGLALDVITGSPIEYYSEIDGSDPTLGPGVSEGELFDLFQDESRAQDDDWYVRGLMLTNLVKAGSPVRSLYGVRVNEPDAQGIAVFAALLKDDPGQFLRTAMHELAHALGLTHCQGDAAGITLMNQNGCLAPHWSFGFSPGAVDSLMRAAQATAMQQSTIRTFEPNEQNACCFGRYSGTDRFIHGEQEVRDPHSAQLKFKLSGPSEIRRGTPLVLKARLFNVGDSPVETLSLFDPSYGLVSYTITATESHEKSSFVPYFSYEVAPSSHPLTSALPDMGDVHISCGAAGYSFPKAGRYTIVGVFRGLRGSLLGKEVVSEPFTFEVTSDPARQDEEDVMASTEVCRYIAIQGAKNLPRAKEQLEKVAQHEGGELGRYANVALGLSYLQGTVAPAMSPIDTANLAFHYLDKADRGSGPVVDYYRIRLDAALVESSLRKSEPDYEKAEEYFNRLQSQFRTDQQAQPFIERLQRQLQEYVHDRSLPIDLRPLASQLGSNCPIGSLQAHPSRATVSGLKDRLAGMTDLKVRNDADSQKLSFSGGRPVITAELAEVDGVNISPAAVKVTLPTSSYVLHAAIRIDELGLPAEFLQSFRPMEADLRVEIPVTVPCFARRPLADRLRFELAGNTWSGVSPGDRRAKIDVVVKYPVDWEGVKDEIHKTVTFTRIR